MSSNLCNSSFFCRCLIVVVKNVIISKRMSEQIVISRLNILLFVLSFPFFWWLCLSSFFFSFSYYYLSLLFFVCAMWRRSGARLSWVRGCNEIDISPHRYIHCDGLSPLLSFLSLLYGSVQCSLSSPLLYKDVLYRISIHSGYVE